MTGNRGEQFQLGDWQKAAFSGLRARAARKPGLRREGALPAGLGRGQAGRAVRQRDRLFTLMWPDGECVCAGSCKPVEVKSLIEQDS